MESAGSSQSRFSFQHFNPEYDIGIVNEHGERVRKRKRPGRKSNPPSVEERREQNRIAQKIFREKEQRRREKQEQERRQLSNEIFRLRKKLAEVEYEANYLRGYALQLSLACLLHRGSVPYIWSERCFYDRHTTPVFTQSTRPEMKSFAELYQVPRLFEMILGENQQILDFDNALAAIDYTRRESSATSFLKCIPEDEFILNTKRQEPVCVFPKRTDEDQSNDDFVEASIEDDNSSSSETAVDTERIKDPNIPSENNSLISFQKPVRGVIHETPTLKTTDDLTDIPAMQALHVVRLQLKMSSILGTTTPAVLLPTALQRAIPHDIRIDYIPGSSFRDRMILFQDYYNADECFQILTQNTVFIGGDIRENDNWQIDPQFSSKFWFLSYNLYDDSFFKSHLGKVVRPYSSNERVQTNWQIF